MRFLHTTFAAILVILSSGFAGGELLPSGLLGPVRIMTNDQ